MVARMEKALRTRGGGSGLNIIRHLVRNNLDMSANFATGDSPVTLFNLTGDVVVNCYATVQTALTSTDAGAVISVGIVGNTAILLATDTVDGTAFDVGDVWVDNDAATNAERVPGSGAGLIIAGGADIIMTVITKSMTAGLMTMFCEWYPLSPSGMVVRTPIG